MAEREDLIIAFLQANGWGSSTRHPLANDASFRRYERLRSGTRTAVLMDAPPPQEDVRPFVAIAQHLVELGYSAPRIIAESLKDGLLILEDLGDNTYTRVLLEKPECEAKLYAKAIDLLIDLHRRPAAESIPLGLTAYDVGLLNQEALLLPDWFLPAIMGAPTPASIRDSYLAAWQHSLMQAASRPPTLVLRDFHIDNLMWLVDRSGNQTCGLLDFQDAVAGPAVYDLMSLLQDARRDIAPDLISTMMERYLAAFPTLSRDAFQADFAIMAAQRHAKVIGIFTRLCVRDAKSTYLLHIPRVWRLLGASLKHPALDAVAAWFAEHVPPKLRTTPPKLTRLP